MCLHFIHIYSNTFWTYAVRRCRYIHRWSQQSLRKKKPKKIFFSLLIKHAQTYVNT